MKTVWKAFGKLPENRRSMVLTEDNELYRLTRDLIALRRGNDVLRRGLQYHVMLTKPFWFMAA
ncbi:hypothetical protein MASR1M12_38740 [Erysipelotrichia bacterium]